MTKKEEYIDKLAAQLKDWSATIDKLASKTELLAGEQKVKLLEQLEELRTKRLDAQVKLNQLRESTGESWKTLEQGMEKAWGDMKEAMHKASEKFKQPR